MKNVKHEYYEFIKTLTNDPSLRRKLSFASEVISEPVLYNHFCDSLPSLTNLRCIQQISNFPNYGNKVHNMSEVINELIGYDKAQHNKKLVHDAVSSQSNLGCETGSIDEILSYLNHPFIILCANSLRFQEIVNTINWNRPDYRIQFLNDGKRISFEQVVPTLLNNYLEGNPKNLSYPVDKIICILTDETNINPVIDICAL